METERAWLGRGWGCGWAFPKHLSPSIVAGPESRLAGAAQLLKVMNVFWLLQLCISSSIS